MIDLQDIITTKRELLSRATCSLSPINYSAGMAEDQKDRYIQYLAEQNQDLRLTSDAMKLVLEDFMAQMKDLKAQVSSMESKHADLENRLSEEHKLRKSAERKIKSLQERLDYAHQERLVIDVKRSNLKLRRVIQTGTRRRMIMMEPMIRFARIRLVMSNHRRLKSLPGKAVICPIVLTVIKRREYPEK